MLQPKVPPLCGHDGRNIICQFASEQHGRITPQEYLCIVAHYTTSLFLYVNNFRELASRVMNVVVSQQLCAATT